MSGKTKKTLLALLIICFAALSAVFFLFSGQDAGTSLFKTELESAIGGLAGWTLDIDGIEGNPLAGFAAANVRVAFEGIEVARAQRLTVNLSLLSLLTGRAGLSRITVEDAMLSAEGLLHALRHTDLSPRETNISPGIALPVILFSPVTIATDMGDLALSTLRLTPGDETVTFHGQGNFMDFPVEVGASFVTGEQLTITDAFFRGGNGLVSLSGPVFPETYIEGIVDNLHLDVISELTNLPFTAKGTVDSTLLIERPDGDLLLSGEGKIENGDIWDLLMEGTFSWSADERKAVLSPVDAQVFSSPVSGIFALYFGEEPTTEIALAVKGMKIDEWTRVFPWLSFAEGTLTTLKLDLGGSFERLNGSILFESPYAVVQGFPVETLHADLKLIEGDRILMNGKGKWTGSPFSLSGESLLNAPEGTSTNLSLRSESFDLKAAGTAYAPALSAEGKGTLDLSISIPSEGNVAFGGKLSAPRASLFETSGENLALSFSGTEERISLSSISFSPAGGGIVSGKGQITGIAGTTTSISLDGDGKNLRWSLLRDALGDLETTGLFDLSWGVKGPIASPSATFELKGRDTPLSTALPLRNVQIAGRFENETLSVSKGSASLFGGTASLEGKLNLGRTPSISFNGSYNRLSASQIAVFAGGAPQSAEGVLQGEFTLSGALSDPSLMITTSSPSITAEGLSLSSLQAKAEGNLSSLRIADLSATLLNVPVTGSGVFGLAQGERTDLKFSVKNLDLHAIFPDLRLGGALSAELLLTGRSGGEYSAVFSGTSPLLSLYGVLLENAKVSIKPDGKDTYALFMEGVLGESRIAVEGHAAPSSSGMKISLKNSEKIDLGKTAAAFSAQTAGIFSGEIDFSLSGELGSSSVFEGRIASSELEIYQMAINDLIIPFRVSEGMLVINNGRGSLHEGDASFEGKVDPANMRWEGTLTVKEINLETLTERVFEGGGSISGSADLVMRGSGTGGMLGLVFGSGQLTARDGAVSGFEAIKSVSNTGEIPFSSVLASFNMDGRSIFLLPGSRISAPPGDNVYRYFSASGSLGWNDSPLDLRCMGDINLRALNAFLGALQGILSIDGNPLSDPQFLQRFLAGIVGGAAIRDFRETSFNLKGTWDTPELQDLKVAQKSAPFSLPRSNGGRNETQIRITVEIPTGEGKSTSASTEDQVKQQLLENIMKSIIKPGTHQD